MQRKIFKPEFTILFMKKEESGKSKFLWIGIGLALIVLIILGFFFLKGSSSAKEKMDTITKGYNTEYSPEYDSFLLSYNGFYGAPYTSNNEINEGLNKVKESKESLLKLKEYLDKDIKIIQETKDTTEGVQKQWFESAEKCYLLKIESIEGYSTVTNNYKSIIEYWGKDIEFWRLGAELDALNAELVQKAVLDSDTTEAQKLTSQMRTKLNEISLIATQADALISVPSYTKQKEFISKVNETLKYWDAYIISRSDSDYTKIYETNAFAKKVLNEWDTQNDEELDAWYLINIKKVDTAVGETNQKMSKACDESASLWNSAYY